MLSEPKGLLELRERRAKLEDEARSLRDEQKKLEERTRMLEEKIIEQLDSDNKATRHAISQLQSTLSELEKKIGETRQESEHTLPSDKATLEEKPQNPETVEAAAKTDERTSTEAEAESVTVTTLDDSFLEEQEVSADSDRTSEKKKRRFF